MSFFFPFKELKVLNLGSTRGYMSCDNQYLESFQVHTFWPESFSAESAVDPTNFEVEVRPICEKTFYIIKEKGYIVTKSEIFAV